MPQNDLPVTLHQAEHDALFAIQLLVGEAADALLAASSQQARLYRALKALGDKGQKIYDEIVASTQELQAAGRTISQSFYRLEIVRQTHFLCQPGGEITKLDEKPRLREGNCILYTRAHEVAEQKSAREKLHLPTHAGIIEALKSGYVLVICTDPHATTEPERVSLDHIAFPEWARTEPSAPGTEASPGC